MKYSQILSGAATLAMANAHATIWNILVDGVDQGVGNTAGGYIRYPPNNNPVKDLTSKDMTCNVNNVAAAKTVEVAAGSKVTLQWFHDTNTAADDIIAASHVGPLLAYMAPTASNGAGDVWVKIAESGYDAGKWAVTTLIANRGKWELTVPASVAPGEYLLRGEIIALHEADAAYNANANRGAQFYMECVQIKVTGSGTTTLPAGVAIPGAYAYTDPGVTFNSYGSYTSYTIPGPAVWDGASGGAAAPVASSSAAAPVATSAPVASAPAATSVASSLVPVATSAPAVSAPAVSSTKSACKPKTTSAAVPTTLATVAKPVSSGTKSACKPKTSGAVSASASSAPGAAATGTTGAAAVAKYGQCGGSSYTGSTTCASGSTCTSYNAYYSQCI